MQRRIAGGLLALALIAGPASAELDLTGAWGQKMHEDRLDRGGGPDIGDFTGLPINDAALLRAQTWDANKWSVPEHQCAPHPADYGPHGPAHIRIWTTTDPNSFKVVAYHIMLGWMNPVRTIWLDGRPHPSPNAPHTWEGFSTGAWDGDTLVVRTTHLKEGWIRRNGIPRSANGKLTEFLIRHDNVLTWVSAVEDPVYLTEPYVRSWNWVLAPGLWINPYTCDARVEVERPQGFVAHWLPPGMNPMLKEFSDKTGFPTQVTNGGANQLYPEYQLELKKLLPAQLPQWGEPPSPF